LDGVYLDMIVSLCNPSPEDNLPDISTITSWAEELCKDRDTYPATKEPILLATLRTFAFDVDTIGQTHTRPPKGLEELATLSIEDAIRGFVEGAGSEETYEDRARYSTRQRLMRGRKPAVTRYGYICMVPNHTEEDDCIVAFAGGMFLYVVRQEGWFQETMKERYSFVGEAYVHGLMDVDVERLNLEKSKLILV
jgi:hypothetical protein